MVGGAGHPNDSATGRFLVFSLAMSLFHESFRLPLSRCFCSQNWVFLQKEASVSPVRERSVSPVGRDFGAGDTTLGRPSIFNKEEIMHIRIPHLMVLEFWKSGPLGKNIVQNVFDQYLPNKYHNDAK